MVLTQTVCLWCHAVNYTNLHYTNIGTLLWPDLFLSTAGSGVMLRKAFVCVKQERTPSVSNERVIKWEAGGKWRIFEMTATDALSSRLRFTAVSLGQSGWKSPIYTCCHWTFQVHWLSWLLFFYYWPLDTLIFRKNVSHLKKKKNPLSTSDSFQPWPFPSLHLKVRLLKIWTPFWASFLLHISTHSCLVHQLSESVLQQPRNSKRFPQPILSLYSWAWSYVWKALLPWILWQCAFLVFLVHCRLV